MMIDQSQFPGIGDKKIKILKNMGMKDFETIWMDFPTRYIDRRGVVSIATCENDGIYVIEAEIIRIRQRQGFKKNRQMVICDVKSHMYQGEMVFFSKFVLSKLKEGESYYFFGKIEKQGIFFKMQHPEFSPVSDSSFLKIVPIYHLSAGLTMRDMHIVHQVALKQMPSLMKNPLPRAVEQLAKLCDRQTALMQIHFPIDEKALKVARYRLIYEELFLLQLKLLLLKQSDHRRETEILPSNDTVDDFISALPFELTQGQMRAVEEIRTDFISGYAMNRLIQGDVGSGKTIVAMIAMYIAAINHKQSVLMAPTTVLAEQHYESLKETFGETFEIALLTSSLKVAEKRSIKLAIEKGDIQMIVGTQAIIQEDVVFKDLALVVTDEQHRFGVRQRLYATQKGKYPHTLVMSATPIPRTLSMILYGDLNVSLIKELPKNRKPIKTHFVTAKKQEGLYDFIEESVAEGRQVYFVCPLVETNETLDLTSVEALYEKLVDRYPKFQVGLVHGKMKASEKDDVMHRFKSNEVHILVATTVIEVGINVPNATIMVIVDTERFGLSQLHQLRGRVGRGADQSYCFMMSQRISKEAKMRIETMVSTGDGFEIAEKDLEMRGPGEMFGLRQHGLPELRLANLIKHQAILTTVQKHIKLLTEEYNMGHKEIVTYFDRMREALNEHIVL
jgi:ATP-dependent DNA helicase RecG